MVCHYNRRKKTPPLDYFKWFIRNENKSKIKSNNNNETFYDGQSISKARFMALEFLFVFHQFLRTSVEIVWVSFSVCGYFVSIVVIFFTVFVKKESERHSWLEINYQCLSLIYVRLKTDVMNVMRVLNVTFRDEKRRNGNIHEWMAKNLDVCNVWGHKIAQHS